MRFGGGNPLEWGSVFFWWTKPRMVTLFCSQKDRFRADCFMLFQVVPQVVTPLQTLKQQTMFCSQDKWLVIKKKGRGAARVRPRPKQYAKPIGWLWIPVLGLWSSPIYWLVESLKFHHQPTIIYQSYQSYSLIWSPYFMVKKTLFFVTIIINQLLSQGTAFWRPAVCATSLNLPKLEQAPRDEQSVDTLDTSERCHQIKCVNFICL